MKLIVSLLKQKLAVVSIVILMLITLPLTVFLAVTEQLLIKRAQEPPSVTVSLIAPSYVNLNSEFVVDVVVTAVSDRVLYATIDITGLTPYLEVIDVIPSGHYTTYQTAPYVMPVDFSSDFYSGEAINQLPVGTFKIGSLVLRAKQLGSTTVFVNRSTSESVTYQKYPDGRIVYALNPIETAPYPISIVEPGTTIPTPTATPVPINGASLTLSPSLQTVVLNTEFTVAVVLDTDGKQTSGTDLSVSYDRTKLSLLDIQPGTLYDQYVGKSIDNATGKATISGISSTSQTVFGGMGNFATLRFRALAAGAAPVTVDFTQGNRNDSNIADFTTQQDILAGVINGTYVISQTGAPTPTLPSVSEPRIFLVPVWKTVQMGDTFDVEVKIDTAGEVVQNADVVLFYDTNYLRLTRIHNLGKDGQSFFPGPYQTTTQGNKIYIGSSVTQPHESRSGLGSLATMTFQALRSGVAELNFDCTPGKTSDTNIGKNDAYATDIVNCAALVSGAYTIEDNITIGPSLRLSPPSQTIALNSEFTVDVLLDTAGKQTAGTDLILSFDRSRLTLVDLQPGTLYDQYVGKTIDNSLGKAAISGIASSQANLFSGSGTFAALRFRAIATGTASVSIDFTAGNRNDSNIADFTTQQDILAGAINASYTITQAGTPTPTLRSTPTPTRPAVAGLPTSTPRPTVTQRPTPTPTVPKQAVGILKFRIKFQGVELANIVDIANTTQKVRVVVVKQIVDQTSKAVQTISSTAFKDVVVRTTGETDQNGIALWEGQVEVYDFLVGNEYSLLIKGPKHLQKKFCQNNPQEQPEQGLPYHCVEKGKLTIKEGINTYDFSGVLLQAGDLPTTEGLQDSIINLHDVSALLNMIRDGINTAPENLIIADIDLNGVINTKDRSYLIETLEEKYGDEE